MTASEAGKREAERLDAEGITALARSIVMGQALVTQDPRTIEAGFGLFLNALWEAYDTTTIGALWGDFADAIGDRGIDGVPLFSRVRVVHRDDMLALDREVLRMADALGLKVDDSLRELVARQEGNAS